MHLAPLQDGCGDGLHRWGVAQVVVKSSVTRGYERMDSSQLTKRKKVVITRFPIVCFEKNGASPKLVHFTRRAGDGGGGVHHGLLDLGQRRGHATEEQSAERGLTPVHVVRVVLF